MQKKGYRGTKSSSRKRTKIKKQVKASSDVNGTSTSYCDEDRNQFSERERERVAEKNTKVSKSYESLIFISDHIYFICIELWKLEKNVKVSKEFESVIQFDKGNGRCSIMKWNLMQKKVHEGYNFSEEEE